MRAFVRFLLVLRLTVLIVLPALSVVSLNAQAPGSTSSNAYDVTLLAGLKTPSGLQDGIGEEAGFIRPTAIWGDGTYLYVGDGPALRRIEIATRQVTTVTRLAGSGRSLIRSQVQQFSGIGGLWGDGTNIYSVDAAEGDVRRINLATGLADVLRNPGASMMFGLVGDGQYLYGGASQQHVIRRLDPNAGTSVDFATPPGPLDPFRCVGGSTCINYFVPSPTSLSIDGNNIYATGYNTSLRIINRLTGDAASSPVLPFVPTFVWGSNGVVYFTEYAGSRIGKLTLATGEIDIVYPGEPSSAFGPIWGDGSFLYIIKGGDILRLDVTTGALQPFAGPNPAVGSVDGVGTAARFNNASNLWSDGANLYIVDTTSSGSGLIRKLNLATSQVATLSTPPVRGIWGDGTYLYVTSYQAGPQLLRMRLSDGNITTFANLTDPNGGRSITGDSSSIYVSENNLIERVALDGTSAPISISMPAYSGDAIWSDGTYLYIAGAKKIVRYSIATGNTNDLAALPDSPYALWGDGHDLFVSEGSFPLTGLRLLKVSIQNGEVESLIRGGAGDGAGTPITLFGYVSGFGNNLYVSSQNAIYQLTPTSMPTFSSFGIPDRGVTVNVAAAPPTSAVTVGTGDIQLDSGSGSSEGLAIIAYHENGIVTSETAVPATAPIRTGRIYASVADSRNTGLAINNPNDQPAVIQFYFTNSTGSSFGAGSLTVAPHSQVARFLNETPFTVPNPFSSPLTAVEGTFTFNSTIPVSAAAILIYTNERSEFLMTTMPVSDLTQTPSSAPAVIPYFSEGGGWTTSLTLVNLTDIAAGGTLEFRSDDGSIISTTPYSIAPRASSLYNMTSTATTTQTGWIRVVPSGSAAPAAAAIFSSQQNGVTVSKTATAASDPATSLRLYTETGTGLKSAVAIANPSSHSATVYFQPTTNDGMPISTEYPNVVALTIPAMGHLSMFTSQLFISPLFPLPPSGLFRIWTDSPDGISVAGFRARTNERGDFLMTATPAFPESASQTATSFPTIVQGGGFTTELVVFGNTPGEGTSGSVQYYSQPGAPLAVPLN